MRITVAAPLAAAWTSLYVVSKIHLPPAGELGVTGGPVVPPERYAESGPGAAGMLGRAVLTDSGGALFGGYCVVWAVLIAATARDHLPRMTHTRCA